VMDTVPFSCEAILVNDGSQDSTQEMMTD